MWSRMFISSYETMREQINWLDRTMIECMIHRGSVVTGIAFGTAATAGNSVHSENYRGACCRAKYEDSNADSKPVSLHPYRERIGTASSRSLGEVPSTRQGYPGGGSMSLPIAQLISMPEGKTLEFKRDLSSPRNILKTLVAFANTAGGQLSSEWKTVQGKFWELKTRWMKKSGCVILLLTVSSHGLCPMLN